MSDSPAPTASETTAQAMAALIENLPGLTQVVAEQTPIAEQAKVDTQRVIAPQVAQIAADLLSAYGPQLAEAGAMVDTVGGKARAAGEADIIANEGQQLADATRALQETLDPEFFQSREKLAGDLLGMNLDTALSGAELEQIRRGQMQNASARGTLDTPTSTSAIESAVNFGDRLTQKKLAISSAIQGFMNQLPSMRTGIDPTQLTLGRQSVGQSMAAGNLPGISQPNIGAQTGGFASQLISETNANARQTNQINANRKGVLDRVSQFMPDLSFGF